MDRPITQIPTTDLVKQLASQSVELVEKEVELAKAELRDKAKQEEHVAEGAGVAAMCALVGLQGLVLAGVFGLARVMPDWVAALIFAGVGMVAAVVTGSIVWRRGKQAALPRTQDIVSGELGWLKKQLR